MIRVAKLGDTEQLIHIGFKIQTEKLQFLRPDRERMRSLIIDCISSAQHLALVSTDKNSNVVGGALIITQPFAYAEKLHSQIITLYTEEKGDSVLLLNTALKWFDKRKASLLLCYAAPVETLFDRLLIAKRFKREGTMLVRRQYNGIFK